MAKNQVKTKQQSEAELLLFKNYLLWLIKMKIKMKSSSHRYDISKLRPRHGRKYTNNINVSQYVMNIS